MSKKIWIKCDSCHYEFETNTEYKFKDTPHIFTEVDENGMVGCPRCEWGIKAERHLWVEEKKVYLNIRGPNEV